MQYLRAIQRSRSSTALQDACIGNHGIEVTRLRRVDQRFVRIAHWRHVDVAAAHQDHIGALAGRERAGALRDAQVDGAVEGTKQSAVRYMPHPGAMRFANCTLPFEFDAIF
jgi:hypothetical protein